MGTFGASDTNKTATQNLYWQWKLETGSTLTEINANDLLDSEWIGDRIVLGVQATGRQVTDSPATQYEVTFDLNGGTLANHGDSTQITKNVNYGETYGSLPIPTREGYTFGGWDGKNLFNMSIWLNSFSATSRGTIIIQENSMILTATEDDAHTNNSYKIKVNPNTIYTLYWQSDSYSNAGRVYVLMNGKTNNSFYSRNKLLTFTTLSDTEYINVRVGVDKAGNSIKYSNIELIEGTAYEPYYITSSTEVVQNQNHTLTAIWEPNE